MADDLSVVGKRLPRKDGLEKVTGEVKFTSDIQLPNMLHAKFLRSPHAHAKITRINVSKAERLPGVRAVLTYKNVPKVHPRDKLEFLLDETIHCSGEEVAAIAAISREIAEEALALIEVEYEVLSAVFDMEEAMKPGAPLAHAEYGSNLYHGTDSFPLPRVSPEGWLTIGAGDVDKGFGEADYILEDTYETPIQYNCSPLPRTVVCQWTGDELTCWADTQGAVRTRDDIARCLGIPHSNVRVIATSSVGGYGDKEPQKIATLTALLAKRSNRPVKAEYSRAEDMIQTHRGTNFKYHIKIGVKKDGTITAIDSEAISNMGRDCVFGVWIPACGGLGTCNMLYRWKNSRWVGCTVITNIVESGAMNGFGEAEAGFCVERLMDEVAEKIRMDPVDFRLKNCMRYGDKAQHMRGVIYGPQDIDWGICGPDIDSFPECIQRAAEKTEWKKKWKGWKTPMEINGPKRKGIGIAIGVHVDVFLPCSAIVKMNQDGSANVLVASHEIGQGSKTAICQVVAETLGVHYEDINAILTETSATPAGPPSAGMAGTSTHIPTVKLAADNVKNQLFEIAAKILEVKPEELEAKNQKIFVKRHPKQSIRIAEVCRKGFQITATANLPPIESLRDDKTGKMTPIYTVAATIVEVEVDTDTGSLTVLGITSAVDCGRAINPQIVENQIDMSLVMGNGWVRSEQFHIDKNTGVVLNPNLLDYKIMTILDMPKMSDINEIFVEYPCAHGAYGSKGMSQTPMSTVAPALANAVYNAIGVRIKEQRLTPDTILEALGK